MDSNIRVTPDLLVGLTPPDIQLDVPDMDRMRHERRTRTQNAMKAHNPTLARDIIPECDNRTVEDIAATRIQATYRGHLGRKKYIEELYSLYEKEEAMRLEKTLQQVEEGQLLVENHQLQVQLDDNSTTSRNKSRQYLAKIITIQRAWRRYKNHANRREANVDNDDATMSPALSETDEPTDTSDSSNGQQPMSVSSPEDGEVGILKDCDARDWSRDAEFLPHDDVGTNSSGQAPFIEAEPDSTVSDYSEMAEPIKEHLANVHIVQTEELQVGSAAVQPLPPPSPQVVGCQRIARQPHETDAEFTRRVRKINYLSLAQEFAALKKIDAAALPFDMHKVQSGELASPMSDSSATETDSSERCYSDSVGGSEAATPIDGRVEFLPNDNGTRDACQTDVDNVTEKLYGARPAPADQTWRTNAPPGESTANPGDSDVDKLDNEVVGGGKTKAPSTADVDANDTFHEQNSTDKKNTNNYTQADFDVYNIESTLPEMDWDLLEEQLHRAAEEERLKKESRRNDREEIRRKLAMAGSDEDYYGGERLLKRPNLQTRLQSGMNLQICFMNEASAEGDTAAKGGSTVGNGACTGGGRAPGRTGAPDDTEGYIVQPPGGSTGTTTCPIGSSQKSTSNEEDDEEEEDFFTRQARLQAEARMALAQVRPMARMQLEVEKQMRKKSPIAEIVGIPGFGDGKRRKLGIHLLQQMNLAQLQVVVNDLHGQIASLNEELVKLLVERDDLHMAQDSMLVDIEDLTRYCAAKSAAVGHRNVLAK